MKPEIISILLVDDDEDDFLIVRKLVSKLSNPQYKLEWINNTDEALKAIKEERHQIYLIDYRLQAGTGIELLQNIDLFHRDQPFIILTGAGDKEIEEAALDIGIADYLVKGTIDEHLLARVLRYSLQRKTFEIQRIKTLEEVNRSKDEFIALASHQLRTPATAVKQFIAMLMDGYAGPLTPQQESYLEKAYVSNERQLKIVDDILKVAQLDLQHISLKKTDFSLVALADDVHKEMSPILQEKKQTLALNIPDSIVLHADRNNLLMVFSNLIDNASKYSPENSTVQLNADMDKSGQMVTVEVMDNGVGIEEDEYDKLFVKFSRLENPMSIEVGGNGLGLYWAKQIIDLHQGDITVSKTIGGGTTFTVHLPY